MHALVIDDSRPVRSILVKMLQTLGFDTTEAENGLDGTARLAEFPKPDLILENWNMPVMNGHEFLVKAKSGPSTCDIPVVVVSAETQQSEKEAALRDGAATFLQKPLTLGKLRTTLQELGLRITEGKPLSQNQSDGLEHAQMSSPAVPDKSETDKAQTSVKQRSNRDPVRVLVVDDSVVVRGIVSKMLQEDDEIDVVNTAADGMIALAKLKQHEVDVILLDIEMPRMDGLELLRKLREQQNRTPVVMFSSLTSRGAAETIEALMLGAKDYVLKPGGAYMSDSQEGKCVIREDVIPKIKQVAREVNPSVARRKQNAESHRLLDFSKRKRIDAIVIAVSTGGPQALAKLVPQIGADFPVPVVIVQHMPAEFTKHLADRLSAACGFTVTEAVHGKTLGPGSIVVARGGVHLAVRRYGRKVLMALSDTEPVNACKPSADVLFESAAKAYQGNLLGLVLTGMGSDGTNGCLAIKKAGGAVVVQDEESSVVWGMPGSVVRSGAADKTVALKDLGAELQRRVRTQPLQATSTSTIHEKGVSS